MSNSKIKKMEKIIRNLSGFESFKTLVVDDKMAIIGMLKQPLEDDMQRKIVFINKDNWPDFERAGSWNLLVNVVLSFDCLYALTYLSPHNLILIDVAEFDKAQKAVESLYAPRSVEKPEEKGEAKIPYWRMNAKSFEELKGDYELKYPSDKPLERNARCFYCGAYLREGWGRDKMEVSCNCSEYKEAEAYNQARFHELQEMQMLAEDLVREGLHDLHGLKMLIGKMTEQSRARMRYGLALAFYQGTDKQVAKAAHWLAATMKW